MIVTCAQGSMVARPPGIVSETQPEALFGVSATRSRVT
jgi:hypothetical protein